MLISKKWLEEVVAKDIAEQIAKVKDEDYGKMLKAKLHDADCIICLREVACEVTEALYNEKNDQTSLPIGRFNPEYQSYEEIEDLYSIIQDMKANGRITPADFDVLLSHKNKTEIKLYFALGKAYFVVDEEIELAVAAFDDEIVVPKVICEITDRNSCGCSC